MKIGIAKAAIIGIILGYCLLMIFACNNERKVIRQDNAALERVTAKRPLLDAAGVKWRDLNPCANDTAIKYVAGDTVYTEHIDSSSIYGDSLFGHSGLNLSHDTLPNYFLDKIPNEWYGKIITRTITKTKVDTLIRTIVDRNAQDSAFAYARGVQLQIKDKEVVIATANASEQDAKTSRNKWRICFFLSVAGLAVVSALYIKKQFFI